MRRHYKRAARFRRARSLGLSCLLLLALFLASLPIAPHAATLADALPAPLTEAAVATTVPLTDGSAEAASTAETVHPTVTETTSLPPTAADTVPETAGTTEATGPEITDQTTIPTETAAETEPDATETNASETEEDMPLMVTMARTADTKLVGTPTNNFLRVRNKPTTIDSLTIHTLMVTDRVDVLAEVPSEGDTAFPVWYKISFVKAGATEPTEGYVAKDFLDVREVSIDDDTMSDAEFEAYLTAQGFPESYKPSLRALHKRYPKWVFKSFFPQRQGGGTVTWQEALNQQSRVGVNMVPRTDANRFKSYDPKTYNYRTDTWYHLDAGWTGASEEAVAYYLDPRNFLDERSIFMYENLAYDAEFHDLAGVRTALAGSFMSTTAKYESIDENGAAVSLDFAEMFMRAASYSSASPIFLAQRSLYEVGMYGSGSVSGTYKSVKYPTLDFTGIRNYYNIGAYNDPVDPIGNALYYALTGTNRTFLLPWNSHYAAIVGGARWIADGYIRANQHTSYLQKFDLDFDARFGAFWHQYMGNLRAPQGEAIRVYNTYAGRNELDRPFVFSIPVIANLPAAFAPAPWDDRSRNNYLQSISVDGGTLSPAFNPEVYTYTVQFADDITSTTIGAAAYHSTAVVSRTGRYDVPPGDTTISINVQSQRGDNRVYQITLKKSPTANPTPIPTGTPTPTPTPTVTPITLTPTTVTPTTAAPTAAPTQPPLVVSSSALQIKDDRLFGFDVRGGANMAEKVGGMLSVTPGYRMEIKNKAGSVITSGLIGTGSKISFYAPAKETPVRTLTVLIYGDADGDGRLNSIDMNLMFEHRMGRYTTTEPFLTAMDANRDGRINSIDMNDVFEDRMGRKQITQK